MVLLHGSSQEAAGAALRLASASPQSTMRRHQVLYALYGYFSVFPLNLSLRQKMSEETKKEGGIRGAER